MLLGAPMLRAAPSRVAKGAALGGWGTFVGTTIVCTTLYLTRPADTSVALASLLAIAVCLVAGVPLWLMRTT
jgi:hypothetical protein